MFEKGIFYSMLLEVRNSLKGNLEYINDMDIDTVEYETKIEIVEKVMQDLIPKEPVQMNLSEVIEYLKENEK